MPATLPRPPYTAATHARAEYDTLIALNASLLNPAYQQVLLQSRGWVWFSDENAIAAAVTPPGAPGPNPVWPNTPPATPVVVFSFSKPTTLFGITLPLWGWGATAFGGYYMFGRRHRR